MDKFVVGAGVHPGDCLWTRNLGPHRAAFDGPESRYFVILVFGGGDSAGMVRALESLEALGHRVDGGKAYAFAAVSGFDAGAGTEERFPWIRFLRDADDLARACEAVPEGQWVIADPMLRVIAAGPLTDGDAIVSRLDALPPPAPASGFDAAPILILADVLEPELCRALIDAFDRDGGVNSGFMQDAGQTAVERLDDEWKRRRDVMLSDPSLIAAVRARIGRRICPEIKKAFQFVATRTERDLVARYDAETSGRFGQHRDDTGNLTRHRRFALSIPLNDDFEGGRLTFPEFGPRAYKPAAGAAVVFSCSLLHRVDPVTRGNRYVFLTFLHDEGAENVRLENFRAAGVVNATQTLSPKQRVSASFGHSPFSYRST